MRMGILGPQEGTGQMRRCMRTSYFTICHMTILKVSVFQTGSKASVRFRYVTCKMSTLHKVLLYEIVLDLSKAINIHRSRGDIWLIIWVEVIMSPNYDKISNCYKYWAGGHRYHTLTPNLEIFKMFSNQNLSQLSPQFLVERKILFKKLF